MGILKSLFGRGEKAPDRDLSTLTAPYTVPAIRITTSTTPVRSHFGGTPLLPPDFVWPHYLNKPLHFLARLQLEELQSGGRIDWLPTEGALLFFYDMESQPWGFEPNERGGWRIVYLRGEDESLRINPAESILSHHFISFKPLASLPSSDRPEIEALALTDTELDRYAALVEGGEPAHQCSGYPVPVQGDTMELECQLASNGLYCGDSSGYNDPRAAELAGGTADWKLLLQIDSDEELEIMWGDCGKLYFWVQESAARRGDFSNGWVILQCS